MDKIGASNYMNELEQSVMIVGWKEKIFKERKPEIVPLRKKKLHLTPFSNFVGEKFIFDEVLIFNYYGLFKFSSEAINIINESRIAFPNIRTMKSNVIYFNSIKIEHIKELAPELLQDFPDFKQFLVGLRNF